MPNHVHLLIDQEAIPDPPPRSDGKVYTALNLALRLVKSKSGTLCNRLLGQRGAFWQHESYDHVVRNGKDFQRLDETDPGFHLSPKSRGGRNMGES